MEEPHAEPGPPEFESSTFLPVPVKDGQACCGKEHAAITTLHTTRPRSSVGKVQPDLALAIRDDSHLCAIGQSFPCCKAGWEVQSCPGPAREEDLAPSSCPIWPHHHPGLAGLPVTLGGRFLPDCTSTTGTALLSWRLSVTSV